MRVQLLLQTALLIDKVLIRGMHVPAIISVLYGNRVPSHLYDYNVLKTKNMLSCGCGAPPPGCHVIIYLVLPALTKRARCGRLSVG